jgi:hypothetical protein
MALKCPGRFHCSHQSLGRVIEQAPKRAPIYMTVHTIRTSMRIGRHDADILEDGISHINKSGVLTKNWGPATSRVMQYAAVYKLDSEALDRFIRRKGGINACAGRFTRWLGRGTRDPRRSAG